MPDIRAKATESIYSEEALGIGGVTTGLAPEPVYLHDWHMELMGFTQLCARLYQMESAGWVTFMVAPAFSGGLLDTTNKANTAMVLYCRHRHE